MGKKGKRTSEVWKNFEPIDQLNAECKLCSKIVKTAGNTTNLKVHLKHQHKEEYMFLMALEPVCKFEEVGEFLLDEETSFDTTQEIETPHRNTTQEIVLKEKTPRQGRGKTSEVWKYFEPIDKLTVECKLCNKIIKSAGNTTNLKGHLRHQHKEYYSKLTVTPTVCKQEFDESSLFDEDSEFDMTQEIDVQDKDDTYKIKVSYDSREALITSTAESSESPKRQIKKFKTNGESSRGREQNVRYDRYNFIAKTWAETLRSLPDQQRIIAEKIINDVFYEAQFNSLTRQSHLMIQNNANVHVYIPETSDNST